jgi:hypothetical protein
MNIKSKKCKGTGDARGFGCGELSVNRRYGLCPSCLADFYFNSEVGKKKLNKLKISASKKVVNEKKHKNKEAKKEIATVSDLKKKLQPKINKIARLIDNDKGCHSCGHGWNDDFTRQAHGGHFYAVGGHDTIRFNLFNIYKQCSICNTHKGGNEREYKKKLIELYGEEYFEKNIESLKKIETLKLTKSELELANKRANELILRILAGEDFTRKQANDYLNIY